MSVHQSCTNVRIRPLLSYYLLNVPQIFQTINNHGRAKISALLRVQVKLIDRFVSPILILMDDWPLPEAFIV